MTMFVCCPSSAVSSLSSLLSCPFGWCLRMGDGAGQLQKSLLIDHRGRMWEGRSSAQLLEGMDALFPAWKLGFGFLREILNNTSCAFLLLRSVPRRRARLDAVRSYLPGAGVQSVPTRRGSPAKRTAFHARSPLVRKSQRLQDGNCSCSSASCLQRSCNDRCNNPALRKK